MPKRYSWLTAFLTCRCTHIVIFPWVCGFPPIVYNLALDPWTHMTLLAAEPRYTISQQSSRSDVLALFCCLEITKGHTRHDTLNCFFSFFVFKKNILLYSCEGRWHMRMTLRRQRRRFYLHMLLQCEIAAWTHQLLSKPLFCLPVLFQDLHEL